MLLPVMSNLRTYCAFSGAPVILTDLANSILSNGMPFSNDNEMPAFLMRCDLSRAS